MEYLKILGRNLLILFGLILAAIIYVLPLGALHYFTKISDGAFVAAVWIWWAIGMVTIISYGVYSERKRTKQESETN